MERRLRYGLKESRRYGRQTSSMRGVMVDTFSLRVDQPYEESICSIDDARAGSRWLGPSRSNNRDSFSAAAQ